MSESQNPTGAKRPDEPQDPSTSGPRVTREQMLDVNRLRRSSNDRYIAGVCGGLARHFDIDVAIVRVLFVVLTITGGASILLYGALWLFVPDDTERSPIKTSSDTRRLLLIAAVVLAALMLFGTGFSPGGWHFGWFFGLLALAVLAVVLRRGSRREHEASGAETRLPVSGYGSAQDPAATAASDDGNQVPPAWVPPKYRYTPPPARPRRTGILWFWPTLALIAIGLGSLGMYDAGHHVADGAYPALALAITATMLLIGSFVGRPGGLIALGLLLVPPMLVSSVVGNDFHDQGHRLEATPATAAQVEGHYELGTGQLHLDLTEITDPKSLAGRDLTVRVHAGEVVIDLPRGIGYRVDASLSIAGQIDVLGHNAEGVSPTSHVNTASNGEPALHIQVSGKVGHIQIEEN